MKIKRFVSKDMRQVLRQVRNDQGPDAVILSNRRVEDGIEVIAAVDYDESLIQRALGSPATLPGERKAEPAARKRPVVRPRPKRRDKVAATEESAPKKNVKVVAANLRNSNTVRPERQAKVPSAAKQTSPQESALGSLQSEVANMRGMLETQLSSLVWQDASSRSPMRAQMLRNLTKIGIGADVANMVVNRMAPVKDVKQLWRMPLMTLANTIPVGDDPLLRDGGVAALVGPTGVGKTTTIAKMASRYAMKFGADEIALISADAHRVGAQEHLATFANILGVKVYPAEDLSVVEKLLGQLSNKKLVLIDTEGTSQRDLNLTARLAAYGKNQDRVKFYLTLAATCQEAGLDETIRIFNRLPLAGAVITKIDEAAQLGCALSALIRHDLSAMYLCDGQRIPDDLHHAAKKRLWLINQSVDCMRASEVKVEEELMIEKFGVVGGLHA